MILGLGRHTTPGKKSLSKNFNIQIEVPIKTLVYFDID